MIMSGKLDSSVKICLTAEELLTPKARFLFDIKDPKQKMKIPYGGLDIFFANVRRQVSPAKKCSQPECQLAGAKGAEIKESPAGRGLAGRARSDLYLRLEQEQPWCVEECKLVNAEPEIIEYILNQGKGCLIEITQLQLCRNISRLITLIESQSWNKNLAHSSLRANVAEELDCNKAHLANMQNHLASPLEVE
jgi:hypothetical protein